MLKNATKISTHSPLANPTNPTTETKTKSNHNATNNPNSLNSNAYHKTLIQ